MPPKKTVTAVKLYSEAEVFECINTCDIEWRNAIGKIMRQYNNLFDDFPFQYLEKALKNLIDNGPIPTSEALKGNG